MSGESEDSKSDGPEKGKRPGSKFSLTDDENWPTMGLGAAPTPSKAWVSAPKGAWGKTSTTWAAPKGNTKKGKDESLPFGDCSSPSTSSGSGKGVKKDEPAAGQADKPEASILPEVASLKLSTESIDQSKQKEPPDKDKVPPSSSSDNVQSQVRSTSPSKGANNEEKSEANAAAGASSDSASTTSTSGGTSPGKTVWKAATWDWGGSGSSGTIVRPLSSLSQTSATQQSQSKPVATAISPAFTQKSALTSQTTGARSGGFVSSGGFGARRQGPQSRSGPGGKGRRGMTDRKDRPNPDFICNQIDSCDVVKSRPTTDEGQGQTKKGKLGKQIDLTTNYYPLESMTNFNLFHYHVEFKPDEERTEVRKKLLKVHETTLGAFIFDGQALYTPHRIVKNPLLLYSLNSYNNQKTQISIRLVSEITPVDIVFLQVYNIIFRNIMTSLELEPMGRFYYDPSNKTKIESRKLEIWPGYITSVRNHENKILLNLELTHKVVRSDTVLDFINNTKASIDSSFSGSHTGSGHRSRGDYRQESIKHLLGSVVLTRYNKKNYRVDDIKWDVTPTHEFKMRDGKMQSYKDYYKSQYGTIIKDLKQPMLVSLPKKKDYHRGANQPIYLVPEICQMTGLNDSMRKDMNLMKDLANHLVLSPAERVKRANAFIERLYANPKIRAEFERWNIRVGRKPVKCMGRVVDLDDLVVGGYATSGTGVKVKQDKPGDWTNLFKSKPMLSTVPLRRWILISCQRSEQITEQLLTTLKSTAKSMNFTIENPMMKLVLRDTKPTTFSSTIQQLYDQARRNVQMFVTLLPNNNAEVYTAIKRKCYCELGVSSQCILMKTMMTKNPASVAARLAIQMNAKLGGEPWAVEIPLKDLMIVGYDVYHSGNKRSPSVGALVASTSPTLAKYFASTYFHKNRSELSANLCSAMTNALQTYRRVNGEKLPGRIILYRDGVGDGQLSYIYNTELAQIKDAIERVYKSLHKPVPLPKFSFIVVTKRIHTRIYGPPEAHIGASLEVNPPPGTVVDDVITRPERYDFYLVSQAVNNVNATVSPTSYNVLWDEQGLDPDKMQRLTLKLCHLYYNYTGTIAVPAPCQFAHKLAYLTGMSLSNPTNGMLQNLLYFL